jgi:Mn-containing catalase
LINSGGAPWTAAYIDSIGDPTCDLRSNIAAEARAKIVYERLINVTEDADLKRSLGFLMTREIAHQKSFEKALYAIQPNFPPGKLPGQKEFENKYYDMSQGDGAERGPWNEGGSWEFVEDRDEQCAVDGGDGEASVGKMPKEAEKMLEKLSARTDSRTDVNPKTGAELGTVGAKGAPTRH